MRSASFITAAVLLSTPCFAWPPRFEDVPAPAPTPRAVIDLAARATTTFDLSFTGVQGNTATTNVITTTNSNGATVTAPASGGGNSTNSAGGNNNGNNTSSGIEFDPRLPAGGVAMITPNTALAVPTYYKVKDWVTFAWNYTSLSVTPSAVDVLATCLANRATYTIALNQTIPTGGAQTVLWDTGAYQATATQPLLTETYTLIIHEAGQPVTARPSSGYLAPFSGLTFGMYVPQSPVPLNEFVCATCSGAVTGMERQTVFMVLGMAGVTIASFTWFIGVAGLW
ncbi:uncharacterized protein K489DRAFT_311922 [Dissoconium aciculare CBS 342.82]|uniref:DUF7137 domain-containing protein n=1 Tax=Dissoconium aciculare CBS 342.82 TaxID=1314786 RepID=A0A6J3MHS2_9PEZI|nr:uncharacterized protein K489DRAFT_311922 [Dissoconium aciculare CBS 342.82]KAF1826442.1 hypothetical protein K489DRAFT_311922 [Dissoconium aciculare CBS 342.82]